MTERLAVDSSAIVAVLNGEPEATSFASVLATSQAALGWPTVFEVRLWLIRRPPQVAAWFDAFMGEAGTTIIAFDGDHERLAVQAAATFGKRRHPARLNFGDCMAYAIAKHAGLALLFKGGDFGLTDVEVHPASVTV